jgi:hypothetical protein
MRLIPLSSFALAEMVTEPFLGSVAPFAGEKIITLGGVVSGIFNAYTAEADAVYPESAAFAAFSVNVYEPADV